MPSHSGLHPDSPIDGRSTNALLAGEGVSIARFAALLDLPLERVRRSLQSLSDKGLIEGLETGRPEEIIRFTHRGQRLMVDMEASSQSESGT